MVQGCQGPTSELSGHTQRTKVDITFVAWNRSLLGEQSTCSGTRIRASNNDADRYPKDSPAYVKTR